MPPTNPASNPAGAIAALPFNGLLEDVNERLRSLDSQAEQSTVTERIEAVLSELGMSREDLQKLLAQLLGLDQESQVAVNDLGDVTVAEDADALEAGEFETLDEVLTPQELLALLQELHALSALRRAWVMLKDEEEIAIAELMQLDEGTRLDIETLQTVALDASGVETARQPLGQHKLKSLFTGLIAKAAMLNLGAKLRQSGSDAHGALQPHGEELLGEENAANAEFSQRGNQLYVAVPVKGQEQAQEQSKRLVKDLIRLDYMSDMARLMQAERTLRARETMQRAQAAQQRQKETPAQNVTRQDQEKRQRDKQQEQQKPQPSKQAAAGKQTIRQEQITPKTSKYNATEIQESPVSRFLNRLMKRAAKFVGVGLERRKLTDDANEGVAGVSMEEAEQTPEAPKKDTTVVKKQEVQQRSTKLKSTLERLDTQSDLKKAQKDRAEQLKEMKEAQETSTVSKAKASMAQASQSAQKMENMDAIHAAAAQMGSSVSTGLSQTTGEKVSAVQSPEERVAAMKERAAKQQLGG